MFRLEGVIIIMLSLEPYLGVQSYCAHLGTQRLASLWDPKCAQSLCTPKYGSKDNMMMTPSSRNMSL